MYVSGSAADPKTLNSGALNAESEFGMGEAVFYQNGDWEFAPLTDEENGYVVTADDLSMMPIYFGVDDENEGLCVGTENYWAVNAKASQEDIDATLEFLNWVITSDEGVMPLQIRWDLLLHMIHLQVITRQRMHLHRLQTS